MNGVMITTVTLNIHVDQCKCAGKKTVGAMQIMRIRAMLLMIMTTTPPLPYLHVMPGQTLYTGNGSVNHLPYGI